jgi:UDP-N-acetylmuramyl pentapeptide synthase
MKGWFWIDLIFCKYNFKIRHIKRITHVLPYHLSYLYKLLDLNLNKKSILDISKSEDVLILNIDNNKNDEMAKRMKKFIVSVTDC